MKPTFIELRSSEKNRSGVSNFKTSRRGNFLSWGVLFVSHLSNHWSLVCEAWGWEPGFLQGSTHQGPRGDWPGGEGRRVLLPVHFLSLAAPSQQNVFVLEMVVASYFHLIFFHMLPELYAFSGPLEMPVCQAGGQSSFRGLGLDSSRSEVPAPTLASPWTFDFSLSFQVLQPQLLPFIPPPSPLLGWGLLLAVSILPFFSPPVLYINIFC